MSNEINLQRYVTVTIISVLSAVNEHRRRQVRNSEENIQSFESNSVCMLEGTISALNVPYMDLQVYL
jgi:hypothetical protein